MANEHLKGSSGGAWDERTHLALHPKNFNFGLADFIVKQLAPKRVLEFGSGLGFLARHIVDETGSTEVYCIEPNEIKGHYDAVKGPKLLSVDIFDDPHPDELKRTYDLVVSIEVAEHIRREKHGVLFDFLTARAGKWIVFSGARVGQGGHGHIAERPEEEWKAEFTARGMRFEPELTRKMREACDEKNINHRRNVMVFSVPFYKRLWNSVIKKSGR